MTETVKAYAKINLHLDIKGIRPDGYHDVENVMQSVSLCDTVSVTRTDRETFTCECDVAGVPTDEKNIAVRAAKLYAEATGLGGGAHIKIEKRIPMAAGLAGGSTDGAAVLVALNRLNGNALDREELCAIGSRLGADVPFCIVGGCAYSDGTGDTLHPFPSIPEDTVFVVACGGEGVSTPWGYGVMDREHNNFSYYITKGTDTLRAALTGSSPDEFYKHIFNIFEEPVLRERPVAACIKQTMLSAGAKNAMMSGSGPSVFGIFENKAHAQLAVDKIKESGHFACVCTPIRAL